MFLPAVFVLIVKLEANEADIPTGCGSELLSIAEQQTLVSASTRFVVKFI
jgi:hypothetical protein